MIVVSEAQAFHVVLQHGGEQGAVLAVADLTPARVFQLGGEGGPLPLRFQGEREQRFFARLALHVGRQHAGRRPGGAAANLATLEDSDGTALLSQAPGDTESTDAGPDDGNLGSDGKSGCGFLVHWRLPALA